MADGGESARWGGSESQWFGSLFFRLHPFLPCRRILEIAPGHGRLTQYLKDVCAQLHVVDVSVNCIAACRRRFAGAAHVSYSVNDGSSLAMVPGTFDLVFSFDSLVHAELEVIAAYLAQMEGLLSRDGVAFLHHSNLGDYIQGSLAQVPRSLLESEGFNTIWRAESVDAATVAALAERHGLAVVSQELVDWGAQGLYDKGLFTDCFTLLTRPGSRWARETRVYRNRRFIAEEAAHLRQLGELYNRSSFPPVAPAGAPGPQGTPGPAASNLSRWDGWYTAVQDIEPYGDSESYRLGAEYLQDCATVEDWGCGKGWFSKYRIEGYVGIDGSSSPFAHAIVDLAEYSSSVDGIFMRHVLEHNYEWRRVLQNALRSFRRKMVLVIYTPWSAAETKEIVFIEQIGVPELSFRKDDLVALFAGLEWQLVELASPATIYGQEHVFLVRRPLAG